MGLPLQQIYTWSSVALAKTFSELHQSELLPAQSSLGDLSLILRMDDRPENAAWKAFPACLIRLPYIFQVFPEINLLHS